MSFKSKTKTIRILTGVLTLCILFGVAFIGNYSVAAANRPDTYIYGENLGVGWYMGDKDLEDDTELENDDSYEYIYTQNGYYCNSYIIEMGGNLYAKDQ